MSLIERAGEFIGNQLTPLVLPIVERNLVPDILLRLAIKQQLNGELQKVKKLSTTEVQVRNNDINWYLYMLIESINFHERFIQNKRIKQEILSKN